jgi:hypothetical protein
MGMINILWSMGGDNEVGAGLKIYGCHKLCMQC